MKLMIFIGVTIFGTVGGWLGALMTKGNWFSGWSLLLSTVGSFFGLWVGVKVARNLGE
jgi:uncharacterized membrane protein YfcA